MQARGEEGGRELSQKLRASLRNNSKIVPRHAWTWALSLPSSMDPLSSSLRLT
jgi:hypothetical protein